MIRINGGTFWQGTNATRAPVVSAADGGPVTRQAWNPVHDGEYPARRVRVDPFLLDVHEVSNAQFWEFVEETNYKTDAEKYGWSFVFESHLTAEQNAAIDQAVSNLPWWLPVDGAYWRYPEGPSRAAVDERTDVPWYEKLENRMNLPVTHVSWRDAVAFCHWREGARLPTEAEWEFAARAGREQEMWPWGSSITMKDDEGKVKHLANVWQGKFPSENRAEDEWVALAPCGSFPANEYEVFDMIGNAWEWVSDEWTNRRKQPRPNRVMNNPGRKRAELAAAAGNDKEKKVDSSHILPGDNAPRYTQKGGSFLCHPSYCFRYRTSARHSAEIDSSTTNVGFRCAKSISE